jgi:branched-chain amino acid transport system permease protein
MQQLILKFKKLKEIQLPSKYKKILLGIFAVFVVLLPFIITSTYLLHIIISCFMYGCLTLSLNLVIGWSGQFSLGHVCFYGMGAYITTILSKFAGFNFFIAMFISVVFTAGFSALICIPTLKLRGDYIAVVTLGFGEVFRLFLTNAVPLTRGPAGIPSIPKPILFGLEISGKTSFYYLAFVLLVCFVFFMMRFNNSGFGLAMLTANEDDIAASSIGINPQKYKLAAFMIGGGMAAIVGSFYSVYMGMIAPNSFAYAESIKMVSMVVLGGLGSISGSLLGAFILTALPEMLRAFSEYRMILFGALMVIMMIFKPDGLWGRNKRTRNVYKKNALRGYLYGQNSGGKKRNN